MERSGGRSHHHISFHLIKRGLSWRYSILWRRTFDGIFSISYNQKPHEWFDPLPSPSSIQKSYRFQCEKEDNNPHDDFRSAEYLFEPSTHNGNRSDTHAWRTIYHIPSQSKFVLFSQELWFLIAIDLFQRRWHLILKSLEMTFPKERKKKSKREVRLDVRMNRNSWWMNYHLRNVSRNPVGEHDRVSSEDSAFEWHSK